MGNKNKNRNKNKNKNPRRKIERTEQTPPDIVPSSSSIDEKSEGKNIYFCIRKRNLGCPDPDDDESCLFLYEWYATKLSSSSDTPTPLKAAFPPDVTVWGAGIVALDSVIYVLGGNLGYGVPTLRTADVMCFDTRRPDEGWKKAPSMMEARSLPVAAAVDGKIYVFGGVYFDNEPFSEFFDPQYGRWEPNSVPYEKLSSSAFPVYSAKYGPTAPTRHIMFHVINNASLNAYDSSMCVVGDVLYCYNDRLIYVSAYHLVKHEWFSEPVRGLARESGLPAYTEASPHLLHIGNRKICLVWSYPLVSKSKLRIFCTICSVDERPYLDREGTFLIATIKSHTIHEIDGDSCVHCLVL